MFVLRKNGKITAQIYEIKLRKFKIIVAQDLR